MSANLKKKKAFSDFQNRTTLNLNWGLFLRYEFQSSKTMCKYLESWHSGYKACTSQKSLYFTSSDSGQEQGRWAPFWCRWSWPTLSSTYSLIWVYAISLFQTSISSIFMWTFSHYIYFWLVFWKSITCIKWVIICPKVSLPSWLLVSLPEATHHQKLLYPFTDFYIYISIDVRCF